MKNLSALRNVKSLCLDTSPLIYYIEKYPKYDSITNKIFTLFEEGEFEIIVSSLVLTETMVHPIKFGDIEMASRYQQLILETDGITTMAVNNTIAQEAASLRAAYTLKSLDAVHLATAIVSGCDAFLTNDRDLKRVGNITVLILEDLA